MPHIKLKKFLMGVGLGLLLMTGSAFPARACTLFAAAGERVQSGGTLIAKNRDRRPRCSALRFYAPANGFKHLALVAVDSPNDPVVAGVNEKGLVVVDATPSSLSSRKQDCGVTGLDQTLLTKCASVDEVLARKYLLSASHPLIQMVADRHQIAWIEIAPRGQVAVRVSSSGALHHTNHYLDPQLLWANEKSNRSSIIRFNRLQSLFVAQVAPLSLRDFIATSEDRHDGPDNSIWRTGSSRKKIRTLASWIVETPRNEAPRLYIKIANPGEPPTTQMITLDHAFWTDGWKQITRRCGTFLRNQ